MIQNGESLEYAEAKDLIQQARRVLESAFEELLRKAQIMGQTSFREALKLDPSLWVNCENEWGRGPGYRNRVTQWNREWFSADSRRDLEQELWAVVTREWGVALNVSRLCWKWIRHRIAKCSELPPFDATVEHVDAVKTCSAFV